MAKDKTLQAVIKLRDEFTGPLKGLKKNMDTFGKQVNNTKKELADFNTGMKTVGKSAMKVGGVFTASIGGALASCTKEAIEFESAFTGVVKTLGDKLSGDGELEKMRADIIEMSTRLPRTANEIAKVAEIGGQLNVPVKNIKQFTETMIRLSDSTDITLEDGTLALAKFMGVAKVGYNDVDRLGSVIVALGNNSQTTESAIVSMATRLAGLNALADFNAEQIMGWSAGLSSAGIEAEMGGSAFTKIVSEIQRSVSAGGDAVADFSKIAQMDVGKFSDLFKKDASVAVFEFIKGLGKIKEQGGDLTATLDGLGFDEVRLRATTVALASSYGEVGRMLGLSSDSWKENDALMKESKTRYQTTESAIQIMKNQIAAAKIEIGTAFLPVVRDCTEWIGNLAKKFNELDPATRENIVKAATLALGIAAVVLGVGSLIMFVAGLVSAFTVLAGVGAALAGVIAFICSPVGILILGMLALTVSVLATRDKVVQGFEIMKIKIKEFCDKAMEWWKSLGDWFMKNPIVAGVVETYKKVTGKGKSGGKKSAFGTKRVVGNDQPFRLHDGERVLTKQQAKQMDNGSIGNGINIQIGELVVREEADVEKVAREIISRINRQRLAFGGAY